MKFVIMTFQSTFEIIKFTAKSDPQWTLLRWNIKLRYQNAWYYLIFLWNIFIVGVIMPSIPNAWKSIETKWYLVPSSIDTKDTIFKGNIQFEQQSFHCSKDLRRQMFNMKNGIFSINRGWNKISFCFNRLSWVWNVRHNNIHNSNIPNEE